MKDYKICVICYRIVDMLRYKIVSPSWVSGECYRHLLGMRGSNENSLSDTGKTMKNNEKHQGGEKPNDERDINFNHILYENESRCIEISCKKAGTNKTRRLLGH